MICDICGKEEAIIKKLARTESSDNLEETQKMSQSIFSLLSLEKL